MVEMLCLEDIANSQINTPVERLALLTSERIGLHSSIKKS